MSIFNELFERVATENPDKPALVLEGSEQSMTHGELNRRSNRLAHYFRSIGLQRGDHIAILMENNVHYIEVCRAALRCGLYYTAINHYLTPKDAAYIVDDSDSMLLVTSTEMLALAQDIVDLAPRLQSGLIVGDAATSFASLDEVTAGLPDTPIGDPADGDMMLYSSGTTGRPKAIKRPLLEEGEEREPIIIASAKMWGWDSSTKYLSTAPLYHTAPLSAVVSVTSLGGLSVVMPKFDAEVALSLIEKHHITHAQFVPTMFIRMLKLPAEVKARYAYTSLVAVNHTAAPCPEDVKHQMIDWWGPVLIEMYGGTESNGFTVINSSDWLDHPGSVGQAVIGTLHICDDEGVELPAGEVGTIYFERDHIPFEYHKDPVATKGAQHPEHQYWTTLGDVGYVDEEGYLYLTDRKSFMIISGGVNIYPQMVEDCLAMHPAIKDVAVIGVPNTDMGEEVKAVVEAADEVEPGKGLEEEIIAFTRDNLAHYMCPRSVDFVDSLPRLPTGKLYKKDLRAAYWPDKK